MTKKTGCLCANIFTSTIADVVNSSPSSSFYLISFVVSVSLALFGLTKYFLIESNANIFVLEPFCFEREEMNGNTRIVLEMSPPSLSPSPIYLSIYISIYQILSM